MRDVSRVLSQAGLIVRRAGNGSTVVSTGRPRVYAHAVSNFDRWFTDPDSVRRQPVALERVCAEPALAARLGVAERSHWLRISALRTLDGEAALLCWVDSHIRPRFAAVTRRSDFDASRVHDQIEAMFDVAAARVELAISAGRVPAHMAVALAVEPDRSPLLLVRPYLAADGDVLQATVTVHPENRTAYTMRFRREAAGRSGA